LRWDSFHLNRDTGRQQRRCILPTAVYTVKKYSWGWRNLSPESCRADLKILINEDIVASYWLFTSLYLLVNFFGGPNFFHCWSGWLNEAFTILHGMLLFANWFAFREDSELKPMTQLSGMFFVSFLSPPIIIMI